MNTERMPWTCRWSQFRPVAESPMWMEDWLAQWACLAEQRKEGSRSLDRCVDCQKYEAREDAADGLARTTGQQ